MIKTTQLIFAFCLLLVASVNANHSTRSIAPFDEILLSGNIDVMLIEGNEESVAIRDREEKVSVSVSNGVLKVKRKKPLKIKEYEDRAIQVQITYKTLRKLKAAKGAEVTSRTTMSGDQLMLDFNTGAIGEFEVDLGNLEVKV